MAQSKADLEKAIQLIREDLKNRKVLGLNLDLKADKKALQRLVEHLQLQDGVLQLLSAAELVQAPDEKTRKQLGDKSLVLAEAYQTVISDINQKLDKMSRAQMSAAKQQRHPERQQHTAAAKAAKVGSAPRFGDGGPTSGVKGIPATPNPFTPLAALGASSSIVQADEHHTRATGGKKPAPPRPGGSPNPRNPFA